jgi:hypothetical protein
VPKVNVSLAQRRRLRRVSLCFFLTNKIERIPQFDIRQSTFDICQAGVYFSIRATVFLAGGWADPNMEPISLG